MKKIIIPIIVILLLFVGLFFYLHESDTDVETGDFVFRMGGTLHFDELNTFEGTYSRSVQGEKDTVEIMLSEDEIEKIHQHIVSERIFDYSEDVLNSCEPENIMGGSDYYYFMTHIDEEEREFEATLPWGSYSGDCEKMVLGLMSLEEVIRDIASTRDWHEDLPSEPSYE